MIEVTVAESEFCTLFAEGSFLRKENYDNTTLLYFKKKDIVIFFVHYNYLRRIYVTANTQVYPDQRPCYFDFCDSDRYLIAKIEGRSFDRFKRSLEYLKEKSDNLYSLNISFWYRFIYLIRAGKNSKTNLDTIISEFSGEINE